MAGEQMAAKNPNEKAAKTEPSKEDVRKLIEEKVRRHDIVAAGKAEAKEKAPAKPKEPKAKPLPEKAFVTGKRKRATARAFIGPGKGMVKVNSVPLELVRPEMIRLKMMEPLILMGDRWKRFDVRVTVRGGGPAGQADAVRQVIAKGLSEVLGPEARKAFLSYDRNLLVFDPRRTETHKPPHSSWGARRYKQRSKR